MASTRVADEINRIMELNRIDRECEEAPSEIKNRLAVLRMELDTCRDRHGVGRIHFLLAEGVEAGWYRKVSCAWDGDRLVLRLELAGPPWRFGFERRLVTG